MTFLSISIREKCISFPSDTKKLGARGEGREKEREDERRRSCGDDKRIGENNERHWGAPWTRLEGWMRSGKLCVLVQRHVDVTQGKPRAADRGLKCRVTFERAPPLNFAPFSSHVSDTIISPKFVLHSQSASTESSRFNNRILSFRYSIRELLIFLTKKT